MVAQVIRLPQRAVEAAASAASAVARPMRPLIAPYMVDDWGRDQRFIDIIVGPIVGVRWNVMVGGLQHVPARAGALLVGNDRQRSFAPIAASLALSKALDRPVRFAGRPDTAPFGPLLRRMGGILARPDEVRTALANGELVLISAAATGHNREAGVVEHRLVQPAVLERVTILPVATMTSPYGRDARVEVGPPLRPTTKRKGPLAEVEMADMVQRHIQRLLDGLGGM